MSSEESTDFEDPIPYKVPKIDVLHVADRSRLQPMGRNFICTYNNCGE